jgi:hypothetical protein
MAPAFLERRPDLTDWWEHAVVTLRAVASGDLYRPRKRVQCPSCAGTYASRKSLNQHRRRKHL